MKKQSKREEVTVGIIYVRTSADEDGLLDLEEQERICREYCEKKDIKVARVFRDENASANNIYRPGLIEAVTYCDNHYVDLLITSHPDRFARNATACELLELALGRTGVFVLYAIDDKVEETADGWLSTAMKAMFAEYSSRIQSERIRQAIPLRRWPKEKGTDA
ncbi:hypothetical protein A3F55_01740 [Candidatus Adlerbacteria bacterium RIFCSPHIGHO2_12_FULL_53_18]|uniref:Resolvase/invertase-type recombinase catalytic domain-containing protein n=1 Tax=Candidatus Adlerbacteria bacterium RIFCSPHIGHO2_12_FULL_53_18 TaxID=1797242 RepID=A0A1F4XU18_9BACT|nr:MAG: hypothetical protein A3F55_01740 [Candidatus Adlerbacteria bacterium RIFCSPHIGHO2_12_FULL_53_18]